MRKYVITAHYICKKWIRKVEPDSKAGFSLVEVLAVITILAILITIGVLSMKGPIEESKRKVCEHNRFQIENNYHTYLQLEDKDHTDPLFIQFIHEHYTEELCPEEGTIHYMDEKVHCTIHTEEENNNEENDVPFL